MHAGDQNGGCELRALLRTLRRGRRQREIAEAAGVSLSLYKKVESGNVRSTRLRNLIRLAEALGAEDHDRAEIIRLARPDLARHLPPAHERCSVEASLRSLRSFAGELLRSKNQHEAVEKAVELLYASLQPDQMAFAMERRGGGKLRVSVSVGSDLRPAMINQIEVPAHFPAVGLHEVNQDGGRVLYAPVWEHGRRMAVLGLVCGRQCNSCQQRAVILETVASMLQMRLSAKITSTLV